MVTGHDKKDCTIRLYFEPMPTAAPSIQDDVLSSGAESCARSSPGEKIARGGVELEWDGFREDNSRAATRPTTTINSTTSRFSGDAMQMEWRTITSDWTGVEDFKSSDLLFAHDAQSRMKRAARGLSSKNRSVNSGGEEDRGREGLIREQGQVLGVVQDSSMPLYMCPKSKYVETLDGLYSSSFLENSTTRSGRNDGLPSKQAPRSGMALQVNGLRYCKMPPLPHTLMQMYLHGASLYMAW